ncbi:MAG: TIGR03960 family B12-binding radical SAM protein [Ruminococcaceae bacterium]|nr:TIGR03960 family B12-binding radical SAM protein [Oscillospiraceae bacterium]
MVPESIRDLLNNVEKPGRYIGGEFGEIKKDKEGKTSVAFCFPDTYEIGMSNLGMKILYGVLNEQDDVRCERVFAPWPDMAELMKKTNTPLYALESGDAVSSFDIVAFTIQYEMCYTNILYMMELAGIPFFASDRPDGKLGETPILLCGGPCTFNPEPFADFFDVMSIGEGEEALPELTALYKKCKEEGTTKSEFLKRASELEGFYVPSLYEPVYNEDGTLKEMKKLYEKAPDRIKKRYIKDFENSFYPTKQALPFIETVHDRITLEVFRGCIRGCRFCQAGMTNRPVREKSAEKLNELALETYKNTGYTEISVCSLSISDYTQLSEMCDGLLSWCRDKRVNLSLPSMRIDSFTKEILEKTGDLRKSSITFAPEAGTQALRDRINKGVNEEDLFRSLTYAFGSGRNSVKLYFMSGLPTETDEDIVGISDLAQKCVDVYYKCENRPKNRQPSIGISVSCFVPKPFTPFQWDGQDTLDELIRKQQLLRGEIIKGSKKVSYAWHEAKVSRIEAFLARGDRKLSAVLADVYKNGQKFDAWDEFFNYEAWEKAAADNNVDISFYANRRIDMDEVLPWDIIDAGVTKSFLKKEREKADEGILTASCRDKCSQCGLDCYKKVK